MPRRPLAPKGEDVLSLFHPAVAGWFRAAFPAGPTPPQLEGWPPLARGEHTLILSPTGSGKTLSAFLVALDDLVRRLSPVGGGPDDPPEEVAGVHTLYVSPLKALNNDIHRNLEVPLGGIAEAARDLGLPVPHVRTAVRTGDTPQAARTRMAKHPPHVLITTPESLYILVTSATGREALRNVRYVIVDEIHAVAGTKRGAHLALTLERLVEIAGGGSPSGGGPVRVGLSATQRPLSEIARFLGGAEAGVPRPVTLVEAKRPKAYDLRVVAAVPDMTELPEGGIWPELFPRLLALVKENRTTLVFANNRRLAERVAARLNEMVAEPEGERAREREPDVDTEVDFPAASAEEGWFARAHHGSMSKERRRETEAALKEGRLRCLVATSSLELGIDVGSIDLVVLLQSPGSVARGLQRVGRSGHLVGETSRGRFLSTHREDLVECTVVARKMLEGDVERTTVPQNPLDVLAQQLVAAVAVEDRAADDLYALARRAYPYHALPRETFDEVLEMLAGRYPAEAFRALKPRLAWNRGTGVLSALPGARMLALASGGVIPDRGLYGVFLEDGKTRVGELDEEFVHESRVGDAFLLGSSAWRILSIDRDRVVVAPSTGGELPKMPFWRGEATHRPYSLACAVGAFRREAAALLDEAEGDVRLAEVHALDAWASWNVLQHLREQREATGVVPDDRTVVEERFRDELGDPRLVVHASFGGRVNTALALALARRVREATGVQPQVVAGDQGILLRLAGSGEEGATELDFPRGLLEDLDERTAEEAFLEELPSSPLFQARFREAAERALVLPRALGRRRPFWLQRLRARDLQQAMLPFPSFPLTTEAFRDVVREHLDLDGLRDALGRLNRGEARVVTVETAAPSPFAASLMVQFVGTYLYEPDTPVGKGAAYAALGRDALRAVLGASAAVGRLRPEAVAELEADLQATAPARRARSARDLAFLLERLGPLDLDEVRARSAGDPDPWVREVLADGRAAMDGARLAAATDLPLLAAARRGKPEPLRRLVARHARSRGPFDVAEAARRLRTPVAATTAAAKRLVAEGVLVEGPFLGDEERHVDRGNLERLERRTLQLLREEVQPVDFPRFQGFLLRRAHLAPGTRLSGVEGAGEVLATLHGVSLPGEVWERDLLQRRVRGYAGDELPRLLAEGRFLFTGDGARVRVLRRGEAARYLGSGPEHDAPERHVLERLREAGPSYFSELRGLTGLPEHELLKALVALFRAGDVANDDPQVVRAFLAGGHAMRPGRATRATPRYRGRWSATRTPAVLGPAEGGALGLARDLLRRYGVVAREMARREGLPWAPLQRVLSDLELAGEARRGFFVRGLSGLQYADPAAMEALREPPPPDAVLVSAADPALFGSDPAPGAAAASAPDGEEEAAAPRRAEGGRPARPTGRPEGQGPLVRTPDGRVSRLARTGSNHVVLLGGRPALASEGFGARLTRLEAFDPSTLRVLRGLLDGPPTLHPPRRLVVRTLDGAPAVAVLNQEMLEQAGFEEEGNTMVLRRRF